MDIRNLLSRLLPARQRGRRAIILGADYPEYRIYLRLQREKEYEVLFFIDEDPWNHRTKIDNAELRYPSELPALCANYDVDTVFYCDEHRAADLPPLCCEVILLNA